MYDVIVIGVGSMGASTCYHLAKRGTKVLGIEQFEIGHEHGSHTGQSRLIRKAYFEHPDYVPLLEKAYDGWKSIATEANVQLYWETGLAYFGLSDSEMLSGVRNSASLYTIPITHFSADQIKSNWPQLRIPKEYVGILEHEAGFLKPELAIQTLAKLAMKAGADIHCNEQVLDWDLGGETVKVRTNKSTYQAKKIVFTAGSFSESLIRTKASLKVTQQFMGWTKSLNNVDFKLGSLPCWLISEEGTEGPYYGFPEMDSDGMKIAHHREGVELSSSLDFNAFEGKERLLLNDVIQKYLPTLNSEIEKIKRCKYTYSSDHNFIIDQLSEFDNRVLIAAGFSGHGFKFVPVVGEVLADLAIEGSTEILINFLSLDRFK